MENLVVNIPQKSDYNIDKATEYTLISDVVKIVVIKHPAAERYHKSQL